MLLRVSVQQLPLLVEVLRAILAVEAVLLAHGPQHFDYFIKMVFVLRDSFYLLGLEQEVVGQHLKDGAGQRPHIAVVAVGVAQDHFGRSVLPRLNILRVVVGRKAGVTHVNYFKEQLSVELNLHVLPSQNFHIHLFLHFFFFFFLLLLSLHTLRLRERLFLGRLFFNRH